MIEEVAIVGAGQAGLACAYSLQRRGLRPVLVDAVETVGATWRSRYDSLRLFTPARYSNLPGLPMPFPPDHYPTKDEVANYIRVYAEMFAFDVRPGRRVERVTRESDGFRIETTKGPLVARQLVVATGTCSAPHTPAFAGRLAGDIVQLHSARYTNPSALPEGDVLIVGAGNSGGQIAEELAPTRKVYLSTAKLPDTLPQRWLGKDFMFWALLLGVMRSTACKKIPRGGADRLVGGGVHRLVKAGRIIVVPRATDAEGDAVQLAGESSLRPRAVIWATGYRTDYGWLAVPGALTPDGQPAHERGISPELGLYYAGLACLTDKSSGFLGFLERDSEHVADRVAAVAAGPRAASGRPAQHVRQLA